MAPLQQALCPGIDEGGYLSHGAAQALRVAVGVVAHAQ